MIGGPLLTQGGELTQTAQDSSATSPAAPKRKQKSSKCWSGKHVRFSVKISLETETKNTATFGDS